MESSAKQREANEDEEIGLQTRRVVLRRFHHETSNSHQAYYRQRTGGTPWSRPSLNTVTVSG